MKLFNNPTRALGIAGVLAGVAAIGYAAHIQSKFNRLIDKFNIAVNETSEKIPVSVSDEIIEQAVTEAVDREVKKLVVRAIRDVEDAVVRDIRYQVKTAVMDSYTDVRSSVSTEVARQVANLDIKRLKDEVAEKAKAMVVEKFGDNLDGLLQDFNQQLANVSKIYASISDSMTKKPETVLKIGV